ncbi:MAG TPA: hypothetical protein VNN18_06730 [Candidatus Xenobia bacterium]|nr:hypothetical protein [Candidatus Xenobia bacterium]
MGTPPTFPTGQNVWQWLIQQFLRSLSWNLRGAGGRILFSPLLDDDTRGPIGGGPFGPERELPPARQTEKLELLTSTLDRPIPLAYGRHIVGGNLVFQQENHDDTVSLFIALGEGEWDGPERVWVNGSEIDLADASVFHFHPGLDGEPGAETDPASRNQKLCSFFPADFAPPLTFSRTAYVALRLRRDPTQPGPDFRVLGIYRTLRVRQFDPSGAQTAYGYSSNPAWVALDILLRRFLFPHGKAGEALPQAVKDRVDFAAWKGWADFCDAPLSINGEEVKRFEAHPAFVDSTDLLRALEWLLLLGRGYLLERNGKLAAFADAARAAQLTAARDHLAADSLQLARRSLRNSPNRFVFRYRALDSGRGAGTVTSAGVTVTGSGTQFTKFFLPGQSIALVDGPQAGESRLIDEVASDTSLKLKTAFSADQASARKYSNPSLDFQPQLKQAADEDHQDAVGRTLKVEADLGNSTGERAERLAEHLRLRTLGFPRQLRCRLLPDTIGALDLLPGDVLTAPDDLDYSRTREWEILEITDEPDGSRQLFAREYDAAVYVDTAGPQQQLVHAPQPGPGIAANAPQMRNLLQNGSFFRSGLAGQEGATRPKYWKEYSNAGGTPAVPTDVEHDVPSDKVKLKTKTSNVDKIGVRTLWKNLGRLFKPGQRVMLAVSLRHTGADGRYNKDVKLKLDSHTEDYTRADGSKYIATLKAGSILPRHVVRFAGFVLRTDQAVPDALNVFLWSEATAASKANEDLEIDWVALGSGFIPPAYEPADEIRDADISWDAAAGLYQFPAYLTKDQAASQDSGGAGGSSGGGAGGEGGGDGFGPLS